MDAQAKHIHSMHAHTVHAHSLHAHVMHAHIRHAHVMHSHVMHSHIMHAHAMHVHAVNCMLYVRINSHISTIATGQKPVYQQHASSIVSSSVLQPKLACHKKLSAPCQLPPKCNINHWHVAEQINRNMPTFLKKCHCFPGIYC